MFLRKLSLGLVLAGLAVVLLFGLAAGISVSSNQAHAAILAGAWTDAAISSDGF